MNLQTQHVPDEKQVLAKALMNAGKSLGLSKEEIGRVIGRDRSSLARGIDPGSKTGELALLLIRCYRSLFVLVGGQKDDMQHWMRTYNTHLCAVPADQIIRIAGLIQIVEYLDAMRGKV